MTKLVYLAGDMLSEGQQKQRAEEKENLEGIGYKVYAPQDDKSINDKLNADQSNLAERIVKNDTEGIINADIVVLDYLPHAEGTLTELGFIQAYKRFVNPDLKVYVQCTDIRQGNSHIPNHSDRFEFSINQYVYGTILEVTEGAGVMDFNEIVEELSYKPVFK